MNYYSYSGRKSQSRMKSNRKKIVINILIIVLIIAACVAFALILGNRLKDRLDSAKLSNEPVSSIVAEPKEDETDEYSLYEKKEKPLGSFSAIRGYLDLIGCPDEASAQKFILSMKGTGYGGFVFCIRNEAGNYAYASKAVSALARADISSADVSYEELAGAVFAASNYGMKSCAYIDLSDVGETEEERTVGAAMDKAVIEELAKMGFSEFIFDGLINESELDSDVIKAYFDYFYTIRQSCPDSDFGLVIPISLIEDPEMTPSLELLFRFIDYFAVDFRDGAEYTPEKVADLMEKYSGSFGAYSICAMLDGSDKVKIVEGCKMFSGEDYPSVAFLSPRTDYPETVDTDVPDDGNADGEASGAYEAKTEKYSLTQTEETADPDDNTADTDITD